MSEQNTAASTSSAREQLFETLDTLGIKHKTTTHRAVFTVEDGQDIKAGLPGGHTKNLFLKDKVGALYLICALGETRIPINKLHKHFGCRRLSFGSAELMQETLGVTPGSVTFFAVLNDRDARVQLVLDEALLAHDIVNFHPMENTATTAIKSADLAAFARGCGHEPMIMDFSALD